jgi:hypothetical protein
MLCKKVARGIECIILKQVSSEEKIVADPEIYPVPCRILALIFLSQTITENSGNGSSSNSII